MTGPAAARTAAANAARRRRYVERLTLTLAARLSHLDDEWVRRLAWVVLGEAWRRGLDVPAPDEDYPEPT